MVLISCGGPRLANLADRTQAVWYAVAQREFAPALEALKSIDADLGTLCAKI
jgi:hypothetical protein